MFSVDNAVFTRCVYVRISVEVELYVNGDTQRMSADSFLTSSIDTMLNLMSTQTLRFVYIRAKATSLGIDAQSSYVCVYIE